MGARTSQLQIRVTPGQKARLKRLAAAAGETLSSYVLSRALPSEDGAAPRLYEELARPGTDRKQPLAELRRLIDAVPGPEMHELPEPGPGTLTPVLANTVAALIEAAAHRKGVAPPDWVARVPRLSRPHFGWTLVSLRPHQIRVTPVAFKRRNLFFDPAAGPYV